MIKMHFNEREEKPLHEVKESIKKTRFYANLSTPMKIRGRTERNSLSGKLKYLPECFVKSKQ